jgi:hypothetical protein
MTSRNDPPDDAEENSVGYRKPPRVMRSCAMFRRCFAST